MFTFIAGILYLLFDGSALPAHIDMTGEEWDEWRRGLFARYRAMDSHYDGVEIYNTAVERQNRRANILTLRWIFWIGVFVVICAYGWFFL